MKCEVIDTVSVLYDHIAVHLNYYTLALLLLHVNVLFCMKFEVIDTVSVLYHQIAVHLNYYTITLYLLHVNVLFRMKFEVIDTVFCMTRLQYTLIIKQLHYTYYK